MYTRKNRTFGRSEIEVRKEEVNTFNSLWSAGIPNPASIQNNKIKYGTSNK